MSVNEVSQNAPKVSQNAPKVSQNAYNLLDFLNTFGINTTTNFELEKIADFLNLKVKVIMKDELKSNLEYLEGKDNLIINYQDTNQKGSHWVCYAPAQNYYFDSYGLPPLDEISEHVKEYNEIRVQPDGLKFCGIFCIYFLYCINNHVAPADIIEEMEDLYLTINK